MKQIRSKCVVCGDARSKVFHIEDGVKMFECLNCGAVYSGVVPESVFERIEDAKDIYMYALRTRTRIYRKILDYCDAYFKGRRAKVHLADVGCRTGNLLEIARTYYGFQCVGVEISDRFSQYCCLRGLEVHTGTLKECNFPCSSFDVVTYLAVFEHLKYPDEELKEIVRVLKKGGILILEIPNLTFWKLKVRVFRFLRKNVGLMPLNHLFYYSVETIRFFLSRFDSTVLSIKFTYDLEGVKNIRLLEFYSRIASFFSKSLIAPLACNDIIIVAKKL